METYSRIGLLRALETYSRIKLPRRYENLHPSFSTSSTYKHNNSNFRLRRHFFKRLPYSRCCYVPIQMKYLHLNPNLSKPIPICSLLRLKTVKLTVVLDYYESIETYSRIGLLRSLETYSRIGLLRSY